MGLHEPDIFDNQVRVKCLIYPSDKIKIMFWDIVMSICLLITCILIPFNMAFAETLDYILWYNIFMYTIDGLYLIDIFVNFNTAISSENEIHMITERKKIAINYIKTWFIIDLVSVIPFDLIAEYQLRQINNQK